MSLKPHGDGTPLTLNHEQFLDSSARDGHERGGNGALGKLQNVLA